MSIDTLWKHLRGISRFEYTSKPGDKSLMSWAGSGRGEVIVTELDNELYFTESGRFTLAGSDQALEMQNEFIWQRLSETELRLEHSRFGRDKRVHLFDMEPVNGFATTNEWRSITPHLCGDDIYSGHLQVIGERVHFSWSIVGPKKDENLFYIYQ